MSGALQAFVCTVLEDGSRVQLLRLQLCALTRCPCRLGLLRL